MSLERHACEEQRAGWRGRKRYGVRARQRGRGPARGSRGILHLVRLVPAPLRRQGDRGMPTSVSLRERRSRWLPRISPFPNDLASSRHSVPAKSPVASDVTLIPTSGPLFESRVHHFGARARELASSAYSVTGTSSATEAPCGTGTRPEAATKVRPSIGSDTTRQV